MNTLRVAYAGHDFFSSCLEHLSHRSDIRLIACITTNPPGPPTGNVRAIADRCRAKLWTGRWSTELIDKFNSEQFDLLVCAAYGYRIPVEHLHVKYAVNVHPTILPHGRGPDPLAYLSLEFPELFGITIHEMTSDFDAGPILLQEKLAMHAGDGFDELSLKLWARAPSVLGRFLDNIEGYFSEKTPQGSGSYWPEPTSEQRILSAAESAIEDVRLLKTKYGRSGVVVRLADGKKLAVKSLTASECNHGFPPGTVNAKLHDGWIVPVVDGLLFLESPIEIESVV